MMLHYSMLNRLGSINHGTVTRLKVFLNPGLLPISYHVKSPDTEQEDFHYSLNLCSPPIWSLNTTRFGTWSSLTLNLYLPKRLPRHFSFSQCGDSYLRSHLVPERFFLTILDSL